MVVLLLLQQVPLAHARDAQTFFYDGLEAEGCLTAHHFYLTVSS